MTDFVFVPLIASCVLRLGLFFLKNKIVIFFPLYQLLFAGILVSVIYEGVAPYYTSYNVADPWDVLAYLLGSVFFYLFHQPYIVGSLFPELKQ